MSVSNRFVTHAAVSFELGRNSANLHMYFTKRLEPCVYVYSYGWPSSSLHSGSDSVRVTVMCGSCLQMSVGLGVNE
jgi:hypothetical protein